MVDDFTVDMAVVTHFNLSAARFLLHQLKPGDCWSSLASTRPKAGRNGKNSLNVNRLASVSTCATLASSFTAPIYSANITLSITSNSCSTLAKATAAQPTLPTVAACQKRIRAWCVSAPSMSCRRSSAGCLPSCASSYLPRPCSPMCNCSPNAQRRCFALGALAAAVPQPQGLPDKADILALERAIDAYAANYAASFRGFVLPGGHPLAAQCHVCRTPGAKARTRIAVGRAVSCSRNRG